MARPEGSTGKYKDTVRHQIYIDRFLLGELKKIARIESPGEKFNVWLVGRIEGIYDERRHKLAVGRKDLVDEAMRGKGGNDWD